MTGVTGAPPWRAFGVTPREAPDVLLDADGVGDDAVGEFGRVLWALDTGDDCLLTEREIG